MEALWSVNNNNYYNFSAAEATLAIWLSRIFRLIFG